MRGTFIVCDGSDKRQTIGSVDELPDGWLEVMLVRERDGTAEVLHFNGFDALAEWAGRQQHVYRLGLAS